MEQIAKKINDAILSNPLVKEYLELKEQVEKDEKLMKMKETLDMMRKKICKDKSESSDEYYELLALYKSNSRILRLEHLGEEIKGLMMDISDILFLN